MIINLLFVFSITFFLVNVKIYHCKLINIKKIQFYGGSSNNISSCEIKEPKNQQIVCPISIRNKLSVNRVNWIWIEIIFEKVAAIDSIVFKLEEDNILSYDFLDVRVGYWNDIFSGPIKITSTSPYTNLGEPCYQAQGNKLDCNGLIGSKAIIFEKKTGLTIESIEVEGIYYNESQVEELLLQNNIFEGCKARYEYDELTEAKETTILTDKVIVTNTLGDHLKTWHSQALILPAKKTGNYIAISMETLVNINDVICWYKNMVISEINEVSLYTPEFTNTDDFNSHKLSKSEKYACYLHKSRDYFEYRCPYNFLSRILLIYTAGKINLHEVTAYSFHGQGSIFHNKCKSSAYCQRFELESVCSNGMCACPEGKYILIVNMKYQCKLKKKAGESDNENNNNIYLTALAGTVVLTASGVMMPFIYEIIWKMVMGLIVKFSRDPCCKNPSSLLEVSDAKERDKYDHLGKMPYNIRKKLASKTSQLASDNAGNSLLTSCIGGDTQNISEYLGTGMESQSLHIDKKSKKINTQQNIKEEVKGSSYIDVLSEYI